MSDLRELARSLRPYIEQAAQSLPDADGLKAKALYPRWEKLVQLGSVTAEAGYRFTHNGALYKCVNANPTFQADWVPGVGTESLYTRIDETHTGDQYDPIPYEGNMALVSGLYYSQDGVVYLCTRDTGSAVYNALADLVGIYVEKV
nr:hypothetical protein [uncultured Oscillibacter sp.]